MLHDQRWQTPRGVAGVAPFVVIFIYQMKPSLDLLLILNLLGAAQALLVAAALFRVRRGDRTVKRLLAAFAAVIAISVGGVTLGASKYALMFPHLSKIHQPFYFLGPPLLFLYARSLISRRPVFARNDLLHFIPFGLCAVYLLPYYFQKGADKFNPSIAYNSMRWFTLRSALLIIQFLVYLTLTALILTKLRRRACEGRPAADAAVLFQIRFLLFTFAAIWALGILHYLLSLLSPAYYNTAETDLIIPLGLTAFVYALAYLALRRPALLGATGEPAPVRKYEKSSLTPERSERYLRKLLQLMETERPYTDGELTLQRLAEKLAIPARDLSRVINERRHQNFADFVNSYRVEEAKRRLVDPSKKHCSILAIAEEVGFNTKSSFNMVFKKHTGTTPSEFRKVAGGNAPHPA